MAGNSLVTDVIKGVAAGAAATWTMNRLTTWMYAREGAEARREEEQARGERSAYEAAVEQTAEATGLELDPDATQQAGAALHWAVGMAAGAAYAVARSRWPHVARGAGMPFGAGFFLAVDELMNPLLGFTPGPRAFPWQTHVRGLAGHLVFGLAIEGTLRLLDRFRPVSAASTAGARLAVLSS